MAVILCRSVRWDDVIREVYGVLSCLGNGMIVYALSLLMEGRLKPSLEREASSYALMI